MRPLAFCPPDEQTQQHSDSSLWSSAARALLTQQPRGSRSSYTTKRVPARAGDSHGARARPTLPADRRAFSFSEGDADLERGTRTRAALSPLTRAQSSAGVSPRPPLPAPLCSEPCQRAHIHTAGVAGKHGVESSVYDGGVGGFIVIFSTRFSVL